MALEWHGGTGPYYYRKRREGDRVTSEYVGSGAVAELSAADDAAERLEQQRQRATFRATARVVEERASLLLGTEADVRALSAGCLIVNGFYAHKRQWRRRAEPMDMAAQAATGAGAEVLPQDSVARRTEGMQRFRQAMRLTAAPSERGGKPTKRQQAAAAEQRRQTVQYVLRDYPEIWLAMREQLSSAEKALIEAVASDDVVRLMLTASVGGIRRELGYAGAPMLEQLLIEQIALASLDLNIVQQHYAKGSLGEHTPKRGAYWSRRVDSAQARLLRATEALARIRRLAMPVPLQVNIGGQQVNVAGVGQPNVYDARGEDAQMR
jgi:hypothetical protein